MGVCVLVAGRSGAGKSTSLRNFSEGEVGVLNVLGKPLPFKNRLSTVKRPGYDVIKKGLMSGRYRAYVIDDSTYLMSNDNFARARETGFAKFTEMALSFQQLIETALETDDDTIVYFLHHTDRDEGGQERVKTIGRMLDEKYCVEGAFPIVIDAVVRDGKHLFITKNDGLNLAKAPMGMLPDEMDNDLRAVDSAIREYWGLKPLVDEGDA